MYCFEVIQSCNFGLVWITPFEMQYFTVFPFVRSEYLRRTRMVFKKILRKEKIPVYSLQLEAQKVFFFQMPNILSWIRRYLCCNLKVSLFVCRFASATNAERFLILKSDERQTTPWNVEESGVLWYAKEGTWENVPKTKVH